MPYPAPVYSHQNATGTTAGNVIDIASCTNSGYPPVMHVVISATASVQIQGSHDASSWVTYDTLTATDGRDLIPGVRFWRTNITANTGSVSSSVGAVPDGDGGTVVPNAQTQDYSAGV